MCAFNYSHLMCAFNGFTVECVYSIVEVTECVSEVEIKYINICNKTNAAMFVSCWVLNKSCLTMKWVLKGAIISHFQYDDPT